MPTSSARQSSQPELPRQQHRRLRQRRPSRRGAFELCWSFHHRACAASSSFVTQSSVRTMVRFRAFELPTSLNTGRPESSALRTHTAGSTLMPPVRRAWCRRKYTRPSTGGASVRASGCEIALVRKLQLRPCRYVHELKDPFLRTVDHRAAPQHASRDPVRSLCATRLCGESYPLCLRA